MIFIDLWLLCNHGLWHVTQCVHFLSKQVRELCTALKECIVCICTVLKGIRLMWGLRWEEEDTGECEREERLWNKLFFVSSVLMEDSQSYWDVFLFLFCIFFPYPNIILVLPRNEWCVSAVVMVAVGHLCPFRFLRVQHAGSCSPLAKMHS